MRLRLLTFLQQHFFATFVLMGLLFLGFGVTSLNIAVLLKANLDLFFEVGWQAAGDGGLRQFFELLLLGYLALVFYVGFKCCERILVESLTRR